MYITIHVYVHVQMYNFFFSFQVEEKPDVTYGDVGGCKEQIEKLKEVVETPLLHVSNKWLMYCA